MVKINILRSMVHPFWLNKFGSSSKGKYYEEMQKMQWNSLTDNLQLQKELLYKIIIYALENIPYYQKLDLDIKDFSEENIFEDIKKIPLLNRERLRDNFSSLYKLKPKLDPYENTSGGSTAEPVKFYQDKYFNDWSMATKFLYFKWAGRDPGESMLKLWGAEPGINFRLRNPLKTLARWIRNIKLINAFYMTDKHKEEHYRQINSFKPKLILAYSYHVYLLCRYIRENNYNVHSPQAVMTTGEMLFPEYREYIEDVFNCPVYNRYGTRETGDIAGECNYHQGMHIDIFNCYVEIIDSEGNVCQPGERGEIAVTTLKNYTMPLIRYRIGDMGVMSAEKCPCGRGLPLLRELSGRVNDDFIREDGEIVTGGSFIYFVGIIWHKGIIKKYQIIQKEINYVLIKVVLDNTDRQAVSDGFNDIREKVRELMGENTEVEFKIVEEILPSASGKLRNIISEVSK